MMNNYSCLEIGLLVLKQVILDICLTEPTDIIGRRRIVRLCVGGITLTGTGRSL